MTSARIAVTGVGIVSALGGSAEITFERLLRGDRGFAEVFLFDTEGQRTRFAAEVRGFDVRERERRERAGPLSRSDAFALDAARDALAMAGLERPPEGRLGIAVGATTGGMLEAEPILATFPGSIPSNGARRGLVSYPMSSTADRLGAVFGAPSRVATICSACSSGASAVIQGALWLRNGDVDCVLAGGTDALCRLTVTGFNALGATDSVPCRPFDRRRGGLTIGEGAGFLLLEPEDRALSRGARVLSWLSGWAAGAEAFHITQPEPTARMPARLLREAMSRAGLEPDDIDYLNAHGTGTSNDAVESAGICAAFGGAAERLLVSSSKGQIGHTLGAAGAIEAAITVMVLRHQRVPPTGGLEEPDEACNLNHVIGTGRAARVRAALSSAFGFGGAGAVLLFEQAQVPPRRSAVRDERGRRRIVVTGMATMDAAGVRAGLHCGDPPGKQSAGASSPRFVDRLEAARSRRFDTQAALVTLGAEQALGSARLGGEGVGLIAGTAFGSVERTVSFLRVALEKGPRRAPPAEFPHLLPSSAAGNASIYLGLTGAVMTASRLDGSTEQAVLVACDLIADGLGDAMVAGGVVVREAFVHEVLGPVCGLSEYGDRDAGAFVVLESDEVARDRGARIHALLTSRHSSPAGFAPSFSFDPPREPSRALVLGAPLGPGSPEFLARRGWSDVPRLWEATSGDGDAGFGLVVASARIATGAVDEALVVGEASQRWYAFHLTRPG